MPLYEYQCQSCGRRFEKIRKFSDPPLTECPYCGGAIEKLISSPAIQFKGSGWYVTDYARKPDKSGSESSSKSSKDSADKTSKDASESKTSGDSTTKPAADSSSSSTSTDSGNKSSSSGSGSTPKAS